MPVLPHGPGLRGGLSLPARERSSTCDSLSGTPGQELMLRPNPNGHSCCCQPGHGEPCRTLRTSPSRQLLTDTRRSRVKWTFWPWVFLLERGSNQRVSHQASPSLPGVIDPRPPGPRAKGGPSEQGRARVHTSVRLLPYPRPSPATLPSGPQVLSHTTCRAMQGTPWSPPALPAAAQGPALGTSMGGQVTPMLYNYKQCRNNPVHHWVLPWLGLVTKSKAFHKLARSVGRDDAAY